MNENNSSELLKFMMLMACISPEPGKIDFEVIDNLLEDEKMLVCKFLCTSKNIPIPVKLLPTNPENLEKIKSWGYTKYQKDIEGVDFVSYETPNKKTSPLDDLPSNLLDNELFDILYDKGIKPDEMQELFSQYKKQHKQ